MVGGINFQHLGSLSAGLAGASLTLHLDMQIPGSPRDTPKAKIRPEVSSSLSLDATRFGQSLGSSMLLAQGILKRRSANKYQVEPSLTSEWF